MASGTAASLITRELAVMMLTISGSTRQKDNSRLIHFRIGGLVSRTQKLPSPFLTKNSSRSSYSLVIAGEMMPSVTTVEHPVLGVPHEFNCVTRTLGTFQGV